MDSEHEINYLKFKTAPMVQKLTGARTPENLNLRMWHHLYVALVIARRSQNLLGCPISRQNGVQAGSSCPILLK